MAKFTFHNPSGSSYFVLRGIPRETDGFYPTSSTQINFISGSGFSDVTSSVDNPFVVNNFKWGAVIPNGTSSFVWPSGSTESATTVPASESQMAGTGNGTITIGETTYTLPFNFTFAPELTPGGGGGGGGSTLATASNASSMLLNWVARDYFESTPQSMTTDLANSKFSYSLWFNIDSSQYTPSPYPDNNAYFISFIPGIAFGNTTIGRTGPNIRLINQRTSSTLNFKLSLYGYTSDTGGTIGNKNGATISLDTWHNMVVVFEGKTAGGTNRHKTTYYLDGDTENPYLELYDGNNITGTVFSGNSVAGGATKLRIGDPHVSSFEGFGGMVDEFAFFTSSLDTSTIESIYSASLPLGSEVTADLSTLSEPPYFWYRMGD